MPAHIHLRIDYVHTCWQSGLYTYSITLVIPLLYPEILLQTDEKNDIIVQEILLRPFLLGISLPTVAQVKTEQNPKHYLEIIFPLTTDGWWDRCPTLPDSDLPLLQKTVGMTWIEEQKFNREDFEASSQVLPLSKHIAEAVSHRMQCGLTLFQAKLCQSNIIFMSLYLLKFVMGFIASSLCSKLS